MISDRPLTLDIEVKNVGLFDLISELIKKGSLSLPGICKVDHSIDWPTSIGLEVRYIKPNGSAEPEFVTATRPPGGSHQLNLYRCSIAAADMFITVSLSRGRWQLCC